MSKFIEDFVIYPLICFLLLTFMLVCSILMVVVFPVVILVKLLLQEYVAKPLKTGIQNVFNRNPQKNY
jgi:hypothetical protein